MTDREERGCRPTSTPGPVPSETHPFSKVEPKRGTEQFFRFYTNGID